LFALEIDTDTRDEAGLSDAQLVDAMVGFERLAAWAQARQAHMLAEFARRRPAAAPATTRRWWPPTNRARWAATPPTRSGWR
jgi:hypothetical protein